MKTFRLTLLVTLLLFACAVGVVFAQEGGSVTIKNPLGEVNSLQDIFKFLSSQLMLLIIPIAVALYVYAGILYLYAAYEGKNDSVTKAKNVLWYTTIGLVIIFIGGGFVDLIRSVLSSAGTGSTQQQSIQQRPGGANPLVPDEPNQSFECDAKLCALQFGGRGVCSAGNCVEAECVTDADCGVGFSCAGSLGCLKNPTQLAPADEQISSCDARLCSFQFGGRGICENGTCKQGPPPTCTTDADCGAGYFCGGPLGCMKDTR